MGGMGVVYRAVRSKESPGSAPEVGWRTALKYRAEAANRLGNTALALNSAEQLKEIAEGLLKTSPDNFTARADRYRAFSLMGEAWEIRSRKTGSGADRRQANPGSNRPWTVIPRSKRKHLCRARIRRQ